MDEPAVIKKTVRTKKSAAAPVDETTAPSPKASSVSARFPADTFTLLYDQLNQHKVEFENLQKEITRTRELWLKEQKDHEAEINAGNQQKDLERRREEETYLYEKARERKKAEDEFTDKRITWEKQLQQQKEVLEKDRQELENLRKLVAGFEAEKNQAVKEAQNLAEQQLTDRFETEKKLREQEVKSAIEILNLKIANLTAENNRQKNEIESLKKALDEATRQVKEIAVKVIESRSSASHIPSSEP
ncbi:hypothetical protein A3C26_00055 [Candidatus Daviesbacteria bacterium RIFCSPHIGHO2_02_FULL_39_12]|uniref:Uncharacterized protein n=2 Tax=Candidatus Daviesiibacteriota TaxID=1752718 RepID=A0A1F5JBS9_9BACT|nr:MAG: hypothetical protein A3C26_00055 [Candidatus Daviesbacteria bacterium RIFCSPHIGHO2_02_FULL_39_12]OGE71353.1 MAG: hypothetical protein A3H40_03605 [Candidatus Daviesbacteria bacterium RIFCSPLOWO2_02_FULL_38_15]